MKALSVGDDGGEEQCSTYPLNAGTAWRAAATATLWRADIVAGTSPDDDAR